MLEARDLASGVIARVRASLAALSTPQKLLAAGLGLAAVGGAAAAYEIGKFADRSTKAAAQFQQSNTLLTTQAGVARDRIAGLGDAFLTMAPKLGTTAQALSTAFHHISSASVPVRDQLETLRSAAMAAAIGNANLEDTTNALVGVLRSGVTGFHGVRDAMATVMAIVGTGNMRLQEFNAAMGTGLPGAAKTFGVSLQSAGAALAFLTDTGMGAQMAATRLTMAMALLGGPSAHASKILGALGLTSDVIKSKFAVVSQLLEKAGVSTSRMAADMRKPDGIVVALRDLKTRMDQAGLSANTQAAVISRAFGGGHMGKAIMQIFEELPRVAQKFSTINASVSSFGKHWQQTTQTAIFQAKSLHGATNSISVAIGEALLPAVQKLLSHIVPVVAAIANWVTHHKKLAAIILASAFALAVVTAAVAALSLAFMLLDTAAAPWILLGIAIVAVLAAIAYGAYELYTHWHQVWGEITKVVKEAWADISGFLMTTWNRIIALAEMYWGDFRGWLGTLWGDIRADMATAWNDVAAFFGGIWQAVKNGVIEAWTAIRTFFLTIWDGLKEAWDATWNAIKTALTTVWSGLSTAAHVTWDALKSFFLAIWDGLSTAWSVTWGAIKTALTTVWSAVKSAATTTWGALSGYFSSLWSGVKGDWSTVWGGVKSGLTTVWDGIKTAATTTFTAVAKTLSTVWNGIAHVWGSAWSNAWNTIKGFINKIIDGINTLIGGWDALKFSVPGFDTHIPGVGKIGGSTIGVPQIPKIPKLDTGGTIMASGIAEVHQGEWVVPGGMLGGLGGGQQPVILDFRNSQFWGPQDVDAFISRFGARIAQFLLPASGMQVRRS